jgi:E3 ubiquitin-protein ligase MARCH6
MQAVTLCVKALRALLVGLVWLVLVPFAVRWSWRWLFWVADAGWEREPLLRELETRQLASQFQTESNQMSVAGKIHKTIHLTWEQIWKAQGGTPLDHPTDKFKQMISHAISSAPPNGSATATANVTSIWASQHDTSILSSWTYLSQTTSDPRLNRWILDVFEGQLITCVVIVGFILIFLIREWVVQQQPLVNLDNVNVEQRERDRLARETERLRLQVEMLDGARARLHTLEEEQAQLQNRANEITSELTESTLQEVESTARREFVGWEVLENDIDFATSLFRAGDEAAKSEFKKAAAEVLKELRSADGSEASISELSEKMYQKLATLTAEERFEWEGMLVSELKNLNVPKKSGSSPGMEGQRTVVGAGTGGAEGFSYVRPPMPDRDTSFRAMQVQRMLADAEGPNIDALLNDSSEALLDAARALSERSAPVTPMARADSPSSSSLDGSWQRVEHSAQSEPEIDHVDIFQDKNDEIPITNAGPDAKINIKRTGTSKAKTIVPEPKDETAVVAKTITSDELARRLSQPSSSSTAAPSLSSTAPAQVAGQTSEESTHANNPFHPEGPEPEQPVRETLRDRVASVFREEFGLDEEHIQDLHQTAQAQTVQPVSTSSNPMRDVRPVAEAPTAMQRVTDWFWGDIHPPGAQEPAVPPVEERIGEDGGAQEAPFVAVGNGVPAVPAAAHNNEPAPQHNNPEVVQAAQQAGLDAEAVEDAEDLEGIFELIGFQGPIIGLFQTSCFCTVLVAGTVFGAVGLPYVWGKLVLSIIASPLTFFVKTPLQLASFVADVIIDMTLVSLGSFTYCMAWITDVIFLPIEAMYPKISEHDYTPWILGRSRTTAVNAAKRLFGLFLVVEPMVDVDMGWSRALLGASVHAHASLENLKHSINAVLNYAGHSITAVVDVIASGSFSVAWEGAVKAFWLVTNMPVKFMTTLKIAAQYVRPLITAVGSLKTGALTFQTTETTVNPSLVYWSTSDRGLAILTGYIGLAVIAAIYVALDTPITNMPSGQRTEKVIRDSLRQAGGVVKVILIISIEMLAFPLYCGLLLDFAFLPLFPNDNIATRWAFAVRAPATFCFVHWFVGTCYMFHFALFVAMCRKILRKGVLWFIRDPDDPTFHPVRDVLERNVTTQLRKIAFSALVYGALVILCLGGVIWSIGKMFKGIFPIQWISTEPVLEFPVDLMLYNFLTPLLWTLFKPSNAVHSMYAWWLRKCARGLRLSHFLFDDRRKDEEGRHVRRSWAAFLTGSQGDVERPLVLAAQDETIPEVYFKRDGKYVLTPCNDQYRPPKPGEAFLHADEEDVYIADKEGKKHDHFAKIYVPPFFRLRVVVFMVCLWMFSAFTGLCATLVPLVFGRHIFSICLPSHVRISDMYAYTLGAYIICGLMFAVHKGGQGGRYLRAKAEALDLPRLATTTTRYAVQALKCAYVYGFLGVVLPLVFALVLQFYLIIPLHTYLSSSHSFFPALAINSTASLANTTTTHAPTVNITTTALMDSLHGYAASLTNGTASIQESPKSLPVSVVEHSVHILSDFALGLLYVRIAMRFILTAPTSRAAEAFRRITANGYLNPNPRLSTRYFVLPCTLLALTALLAPLGIAAVGMEVAEKLGWQDGEQEVVRTLVYRFSYPVAAGLGTLMWGFGVVGAVVKKWRASVRDEVYLVGERLHNFGEGRPPSGSRSVLRKER